MQVACMMMFTESHRCEIAVAASSEICIVMTQSHVFMYFPFVLLVDSRRQIIVILLWCQRVYSTR